MKRYTGDEDGIYGIFGVIIFEISHEGNTVCERNESEQNTSQPAGPSQPTAIRTNEVRSLPCFEPRAEPHTLSVRWKRWKRSFLLYVLAKGIVEDRQKVALLLHTAGQEVQDLYYVMELLDSYFVPKVNVPFERNVFRQMEQQSHEKVDQFVCRLRQKAITCEFANVEETIRDQLIEKCRDGRLRRKFLEKTNATLKLTRHCKKS